MAVRSKRERESVYTFIWVESLFKSLQKKELVVPELIKEMVWCGDNLCVGYKREYNMIDTR